MGLKVARPPLSAHLLGVIKLNVSLSLLFVPICIIDTGRQVTKSSLLRLLELYPRTWDNMIGFLLSNFLLENAGHQAKWCECYAQVSFALMHGCWAWIVQRLWNCTLPRFCPKCCSTWWEGRLAHETSMKFILSDILWLQTAWMLSVEG